MYKNNLSYPCQTCKILPNFPSRGYKISMYSPNLQLRQCQLRLQDLWTNPYKAIQIEHFWIFFWNESTKPVVQKLGLKSNPQIRIFKNQTCKSGFVTLPRIRSSIVQLVKIRWIFENWLDLCSTILTFLSLDLSNPNWTFLSPDRIKTSL